LIVTLTEIRTWVIGENGVSNTIKEIVEDAEAIKDTLKSLADEVNNVEEPLIALGEEKGT